MHLYFFFCMFFLCTYTLYSEVWDAVVYRALDYVCPVSWIRDGETSVDFIKT